MGEEKRNPQGGYQHVGWLIDLDRGEGEETGNKGGEFGKRKMSSESLVIVREHEEMLLE